MFLVRFSRMSQTVLFTRSCCNILAVLSLLFILTAQAAEAETAIAMLPSSVCEDSVRQQAQLAYQRGQFEQALGFYRQLTNSGAGKACDLYWMAEACSQLGHFEEACDTFDKAAKLDGTNELLRVRLAESYLAARRNAQARQACESGLAVVKDMSARQKLTVLLKLTAMPMPEVQRGKFGSTHGNTER